MTTKKLVARAALDAARVALLHARALLFDIARLKGRAGIEVLREDFERIDSAIGGTLSATSIHDAGAYARCSYCGRYSASPVATRGDKVAEAFAPCDCGKGASGWSGSFKPPGPDAKWSIGVNREPAPEEFAE